MTQFHESITESSTTTASAPDEEGDGITCYFTDIPTAGRSSDRIAQIVGTTFAAIEQALSPILGQRGVAALYKRSLHLAKKKYSWLPDSPASDRTAIDVCSLMNALAQQEPMDAGKAGTAVLRDFYALLSSLIGPSLTERLLRPVWVDFLSGSTTQDETR
ncbi:hypothetical protein [Variovorax ginsengisoli]|uniref:Uncharacterized protein n=1 Tax=Variovorax ginsengisoli TaxID=363844 RepID=A0ABT9S1H2_9BURK|nr:hypothetical protein [Variovorax ginsengisoli]MDP9898198.1 hypothetical protein [Variovorax ginsengisoli]